MKKSRTGGEILRAFMPVAGLREHSKPDSYLSNDFKHIIVVEVRFRVLQNFGAGIASLNQWSIDDFSNHAKCLDEERGFEQ